MNNDYVLYILLMNGRLRLVYYSIEFVQHIQNAV